MYRRSLCRGVSFLAAYPIEPALETIERYLKRSAEVDATFIQMEDEISALAAVIGASWTGKKSMTVTSGPGFSNMMEHLGSWCDAGNSLCNYRCSKNRTGFRNSKIVQDRLI